MECWRGVTPGKLQTLEGLDMGNAMGDVQEDGMYPIWEAEAQGHRAPCGGNAISVLELATLCVEALENVAFTATAISRGVDAVLDGRASVSQVASHRSRCLDLRNTAARECLMLRYALVQVVDAPDLIAA
jgi:hypothetical protein